MVVSYHLFEIYQDHPSNYNVRLLIRPLDQRTDGSDILLLLELNPHWLIFHDILRCSMQEFATFSKSFWTCASHRDLHQALRVVLAFRRAAYSKNCSNTHDIVATSYTPIKKIQNWRDSWDHSSRKNYLHHLERSLNSQFHIDSAWVRFQTLRRNTLVTFSLPSNWVICLFLLSL